MWVIGTRNIGIPRKKNILPKSLTESFTGLFKISISQETNHSASFIFRLNTWLSGSVW